MMQAEESGTAARQRATEGLTRQSNVNIQQGQQLARLGMQAYQEGAQREQQRKIATGQEMQETRRQEFKEGQAGMERVPGGDQPPLSREEGLRQEMGKGTAGEQPQAAGATMAPEEAPPAGQEEFGPQLPETSTRDPEDVGRLQRQGEQPIEIGGQGAPVPGEPQEPGALRLSKVGERRESRADMDAMTRRLAVMSRQANTQNSYAMAQIKKDKVMMERIEKQLDAGNEQIAETYSRFKDPYGKPEIRDWVRLEAWAKDVGMENNAADGGALMAIIKKGRASPGYVPSEEELKRIEGFTRGYMSRQALVQTGATGKVSRNIDFTTPMGQAFVSAQNQFAARMQSAGPYIQQIMIRSFGDKLDAQNRFASFMVLGGQVSMPGGGAFGGPQAPPPSLGGQSAQPQQQQQAGDQARGMGEDVTQYMEQTDIELATKKAQGIGTPGQLFGDPGERPGMPMAAPDTGRVHGREYEYPRPGKKGDTGPQRSRTERVHGERRQEKVRELEEQGFDKAAATLAQADTKWHSIGKTEDGQRVYNTIPTQSNPADWKWTEYEPGEWGWLNLVRAKERKE